jgi:hypothetical protein
VVTGASPIAARLAEGLRARGALARCYETATGALEEIEEIDGLIMLDGLASQGIAAPVALFPLIKEAGERRPAGGLRWLLAAGHRDGSDAAGLAGMFLTIDNEHPHVSASMLTGSVRDRSTAASRSRPLPSGHRDGRVASSSKVDSVSPGSLLARIESSSGRLRRRRTCRGTAARPPSRSSAWRGRRVSRAAPSGSGDRCRGRPAPAGSSRRRATTFESMIFSHLNGDGRRGPRRERCHAAART